MHTKQSKLSWNLENTYSNLPEPFFRLQNPVPVANPKMICFNTELADQLGLDFLDEKNNTAYLAGNLIPEGAQPISQAYAGHQFGHFTMLGDGRATLIGEQIDESGLRFDVQLKGSGQTPFSRRGDGRATLYSMLREYLISESMYHLEIPTSRSLAVVATGEQVFRGEMHEGAVLTRIAESHLRVGTFEYARNFTSIEDMRALLDYTLNRHYTDKINSKNPALELLKIVMHKQIDLIAHWMRVGFIHGVMNTDNTSIAGETIDYGPCAFMNSYKLNTVFSSIDEGGRYAFGNQPKIIRWNITALANALLPLISDDQDEAIKLAQEMIDGFQYKFTERWYGTLLNKLGILNPLDEDRILADELLYLMENHEADYTQTFLALEEEKELDQPLFHSEKFKKWKIKWDYARLRKSDLKTSKNAMRKHNPRVIPRNHWVENALEEAVKGNMNPFNELLEILSKPYANHPDDLKYQSIPIDFDQSYQTFCGT